MRRVFKLFSIGLAIIAVIASPAQAAIDDAGAERLKAAIENFISFQFGAQSMGGGEIIRKGDIVVEQTGSYYAVTTPHITFKSITGEKFELGMVAINATPGNAEGSWKMSIAIPTPMTFYDVNGDAAARIDIGSQRTSGIFYETFNNFVKGDAQYKDIKVNTSDNDFRIDIPELGMQVNMSETANGTWSGPYSYTLKNPSIYADDGTGGSVKNISAHGEMFELDMQAYKKSMEEMQAFFETMTPEALMNTSNESGLAFFKTLVDMYKSMGDGFTSQFDMDGLKIKIPAEEQGGKLRDVDVANIGFGFDMRGFVKNDARISFRTNMNGFDMSGVFDHYKELSPTDFNMDISVNQIPYDELIELGMNSMKTSLENPAAAQFAGVQAMMSLPQILTASGTNLAIKDTYFGNNSYTARANGTIEANVNSVSGATGNILAEIVGMDKIIQSIQSSLAAASPEDQQGLQGALAAFMMLDGLGEAATDEKGQTVERFQMIMDEQGQMLINGNDLSALMGGGAPAAQPPAMPGQ